MDRQAVSSWVLSLTSPVLRLSRAKTLAWIVAGVAAVRQLTLPEIATALAGPTTLKHRIKRLSRFLANDGIDPQVAFSPFIRQLIAGRKRKPLVLALDWTQFRKIHTLALVGVFGGRGVPLLWHSVGEFGLYKRQSEIEKRMLSHLASLLPKGCRVVILADRGFGKTDLARHCQSLGLEYLIRIKPDVHIRCGRHAGLLSSYELRVGQCHVLREVSFRKADPVVQQVVVKRTAQEAFYFMTSLTASARRLIALYHKRMPIEETFRDQKSHRSGFALGATRVRHPDRLDRLLLVLAIGLLLLFGLGLKVKATYPPSHWSSNRRADECSVLTIARRMQDPVQVSPRQALSALKSALHQTSPNWG